jgi:sirohydrochlorin cobaltochelatase
MPPDRLISPKLTPAGPDVGSGEARQARLDDLGWGLLLIGHGTRDPVGREEFLQAADLVAQRAAPRPVEACFLEIAEPTIAAGLQRLAARGVAEVGVVPLLLLAAGHAKRDVPEALAAGAARCVGLRWHLAPHVGSHELVAALAAKRFAEALAAYGSPPAISQGVRTAPTLLVLVGRGTSDPDAMAEMGRFAAAHSASVAMPVEVCFMAAARPLLEEKLAEVARRGFGRVVVQPHLLFAGEVLDQLQAMVEVMRARNPQIEWVLAGRLGPDPLLAEAAWQQALHVIEFVAGTPPERSG